MKVTVLLVVYTQKVEGLFYAPNNSLQQIIVNP